MPLIDIRPIKTELRQKYRSLRQSMPPEIKEERDEAIAKQRAATIENEEKFYTLLEEGGVTVPEFKDRAKVIELFTPMWKEFAEGADCVSELEAIIALS